MRCKHWPTVSFTERYDLNLIWCIFHHSTTWVKPTRPRPSAAAAFTNAAHEYYLEQHATSEVGHRLNVSCQLCVLPSFHFTVEHRYYCNSSTTGPSSLAEWDYLIGKTAEWVDDEVNEGLLMFYLGYALFSSARRVAFALGGEIAWNKTWSAIIDV